MSEKMLIRCAGDNSDSVGRHQCQSNGTHKHSTSTFLVCVYHMRGKIIDQPDLVPLARCACHNDCEGQPKSVLFVQCRGNGTHKHNSRSKFLVCWRHMAGRVLNQPDLAQYSHRFQNHFDDFRGHVSGTNTIEYDEKYSIRSEWATGNNLDEYNDEFIKTLSLTDMMIVELSFLLIIFVDRSRLRGLVR